MLYTDIPIKVNYNKVGAVQNGYQPILHCYLMNSSDELMLTGQRPGVIICQGGAYRFKSDREGEPVAMRFLAAGIQAFVLDYSIAPSRFPCSMLELAEAVGQVRAHAKEWGIDPGKLFICGFSAGGHLCASLGTMWMQPLMRSIFGDKLENYCPNGMILGYPVITSGEFTHKESCRMLLGENPDENLLEKISLENQVTEHTPPAFIWHTQEDESVPVENTLLFAGALRRCGVPFELHIYESGAHGLSLCDETTAGAKEHIIRDNEGWIEHAIRWLLRK